MSRGVERQSVTASAVPAAPAALWGFCASCPRFSYCFFYFVLSWNTHSPWKIFSTQLKGCVLAQAGATGWTLATMSPGFAVNEVPLLLYALPRGEAEADKGTRLPNMASQRAWLGVEFEVTSSLICYVFMGPSFFLCSKLSLNTLFLSCSSKHSGNVEIM